MRSNRLVAIALACFGAGCHRHGATQVMGGPRSGGEVINPEGVIRADPIAPAARIVPDTQQTRMIASGALADVVPGTMFSSYRGSFVVRQASRGQITGAVPTGQMTIYYKLPVADSISIPAQTGDTLTLNLQNGFVDGALRRVVHLARADTALLYYIAVGGDRPYDSVGGPQIKLEQKAPPVDSAASPRTPWTPCAKPPPDPCGLPPRAVVSLSYGDSTLLLMPGQHRRVTEAAGPMEFVLISSVTGAPDTPRPSDGPPYYLKLIGYRLKAAP